MTSQSAYNRFGIISVHAEVHGRKIRGFSTPVGVANFLGVQYGTIPKRFLRSQLVDLESLEADIDATDYGPQCPQPENLARKSREHLYKGAQPWTSPISSELGCLRLNIYTPTHFFSNKEAKLPVLVWIHGGGFVGGDGNWEYDGNPLVHLSISSGKPFVLVSISYRLGYFGFLSSKELQDEATANREQHVPNQGLYDQRLALQWVQKYIHHFGGDASNVTVAGQSAGAWAAHTHVASKERLCSKGLIMSSMAFSQNTPEEAQAVFDNLVERVGVPASAPGPEKLAALRNLPADQLANFLRGSMMVKPTWDSTWFYGQETQIRIEQISNLPTWIRGLMAGSTRDETAFLYHRWEPLSAEKLCKIADSAIKSCAGPPGLADAYGISPSKSQDEVLKGVIDFTTDSFFGLFPHWLSKAETPVSVYRFDQPDSLSTGALRNWSYHCLDTPHLFRLPAITGPGAPASAAATSNAMAESMLEFLHGDRPWAPIRESGKMMVFKGNASGLVAVPKSPRWDACVSSADEDGFANAGLAFLLSKL